MILNKTFLSSRIELNSTDFERDLGVLISSDLKSTNQINKANSLLVLLKRTFVNRDAQSIGRNFTSITSTTHRICRSSLVAFH